MSESGFQLTCLRDERLAPLATSALPAWLWSADADRILWANATGAAIFGAATSLAIGSRKFDIGQPAAAQIAQLAATLPPEGSQHPERLRGFGAGVGRTLACACSRVTLADDTAAILVVAAERAGPDLALDERVRRLLAGCDQPAAIFALEGRLIHATPAAEPRLAGAASLAALDALALAADAVSSGRAEGTTPQGPIAIARLGSDAGMVLLATFPPPAADAASDAVLAPDAAAPAVAEASTPPSPPPAPPVPPERRHPLRFVWQMDEAGRFTLGSDEFIGLVGPRTAAALGRPWQQIAAELDLDPEGRVAQSIATHETWSGLTVRWPIDDGAERLAVELSGLPVFDRARVFRGYRGFGVCRDCARLAELAHRHCAASNPAVAADAAGAAPVEPGEPSALPAAENVLPFPSAAEPNAPALSPIERSAFRELSRRLAQRLNHQDVATTAADDDAATAAMPRGERAGPDPPENGAAVGASQAAEQTRDALFEHDPESAAVGMTTDARSFLDRLPFGVLVYRLSQLLYANHAFLQWSGYASIEALAEEGGLDSLFVEPAAVSFEKRGEKPFAITSSRGDNPEAEGRLFLVPWEGEQAFALMTIPVSEERAKVLSAALAPLQAEIAELRSILDTATDGVVVLDRAGVILSSNHGAEALFGYQAGELAGGSFFDLLASQSMEIASQYLNGLRQDAAAELPEGGHEVVGRLRGGGSIPLFMSMGRIGEATGKLCAVFRDLTPWKLAEEELTEAKRRAEQASSAKSDFVAKISHEIRTPLNAIIGFSEVMIEERFGPIDNERYRGYLGDIHASGGHLISLINDLLDLSKIEAGKLDLTFAGVALNELIQECVAIMQPQANRERVLIRTSLSAKLPQVVADARSLRQIVLNLLSNSIKFTGAGGQVIVSTAPTDGGEVVLRVRDTGIGMSEQDIATALEPFRQLATTARRGGTGLGLPLTKALAEANRASFRIKSEPNDGTLVEIAFPASQVLPG